MTTKIASRCAASISLLMLAGCVPAWQMQPAVSQENCQVRICVNPDSARERCGCQSRERIQAIFQS